MTLYERLNDITPNAFGRFITWYNADKHPYALIDYPDAALYGLLLYYLRDEQDMFVTELVANDLFGGFELIMSAFSSLEQDYFTK